MILNERKIQRVEAAGAKPVNGCSDGAQEVRASISNLACGTRSAEKVNEIRRERLMMPLLVQCVQDAALDSIGSVKLFKTIETIQCSNSGVLGPLDRGVARGNPAEREQW